MTKMGTGTLTLSGVNTYSGGTALNGGTLNLGNNNALGTGSLTLEDGTTLQAGTNGLAVANTVSLNGTDTYDTNGNGSSLSGVISGSGGLDVTGSGALTLTGTNTYGGGTALNGGTLNLGNNSALGTGSLTLEDGTTLQAGTNGLAVTNAVSLNGNDAYDTNGNSSFLSGVISGSGGLDVTGSGVLTLSGIDSYTGGTSIVSGTLVAANNNALGAGSVVVNGGTLSVSGLRTVTIGGNYTQLSTGTLQLGMGGTAAGDWDMLKISGAATLAGTLRLVSVNGFQFQTHGTQDFEILSAGSVDGKFNPVMNGITAGSVSLVYDPQEILLEVSGPTYQSLGVSPNQKSVGGALDYLNAHSADPALMNILNTKSNAVLPGIYNQISPAILTSIYQICFSTAESRAAFVLNRLGSLFEEPFLTEGMADSNIIREGPLFAGKMSAKKEKAIMQEEEEKDETAEPPAVAAPENRFGVYVDGLGNFGSVTGDSNAAGYNFTTSGMAAGMDYRFNQEWAGGLLLGYSNTGTTQSGSNSVSVTGGQAGLYGGWNHGKLRLEALVDGGINSYKTQRESYGGVATGSTQGVQYGGQLTCGIERQIDKVALEMFLSGQYTDVNINSFQETGSSLTNLNIPSQGESSVLSQLGAKAGWSWKMGNVSILPSLSLAWEHVYQGNQDSLNATLGSANNLFTVQGPATGTDVAVIGADINAKFSKGFGAFVQYQGKLGLTNYGFQNVTGGVNFGF